MARVRYLISFLAHRFLDFLNESKLGNYKELLSCIYTRCIISRNNREHAHACLLPRTPAEAGRRSYLEPITLHSSVVAKPRRVIGTESKQPSDGTLVC